MRRRILIVLAALVLAGMSAVAVLVYVRGADQRAVADRAGVWVLLADKRIPAGTTGEQIRDGDLAQRVLMPAETVPDGSLGELGADLDSLRLATELAPQQMLMRGLFSNDLDTAAQAGVPDGKLAITVQVTMAPGVAEKVSAGDEVTVFVTYPRDERASEQKTRVLLPQATVISIRTGPPVDVTPTPTTTSGSRIGTSGARSDRAYPATLAVSPGDATRLVHAAQTGLIYLGLVGLETSVSPSAAVDYDNLWK
jgi:pilus assembly protein CpaB